MAILTRYIERHLSDASNSLLLVNTNADDVSISCFNARVKHSLEQLHRTDIMSLMVGFGDIARSGPDHQRAGDLLTPAAPAPRGYSLCFLLFDLSRPLSRLDGTAAPLRQLSPAEIASEILRMAAVIESAHLATRSSGRSAEEPATTQLGYRDFSIMPIALVSRTVDVVVARLLGRILNQYGSSLYCAKVPTGGLEQRPVVVYERWEPGSVVVLAAGKSSRMGRAKQIEIVNGQPMVVKAVTTALCSGAQKVILVTGAYAEEITDLLERTGLSAHPLLQIVHNPDYAVGQSTTVKAAITHLQTVRPTENLFADWGAAVVMPVDQPYLTPLLIRRLFRLWRSGVQIAAPSIRGIPRGAPALFDNSLWPHLSQLSGDIGAKPLLKQFREQLVTIESPQHALSDIDSPEDLPV